MVWKNISKPENMHSNHLRQVCILIQNNLIYREYIQNSVDAVSTLMNIESSQKRRSNNRGFRGIGRLDGMGYCGCLVFTTSVENENRKTIVEFDCKKLRCLFVPGSSLGN